MFIHLFLRNSANCPHPFSFEKFKFIGAKMYERGEGHKGTNQFNGIYLLKFSSLNLGKTTATLGRRRGDQGWTIGDEKQHNNCITTTIYIL